MKADIISFTQRLLHPLPKTLYHIIFYPKDSKIIGMNKEKYAETMFFPTTTILPILIEKAKSIRARNVVKEQSMDQGPKFLITR